MPRKRWVLLSFIPIHPCRAEIPQLLIPLVPFSQKLSFKTDTSLHVIPFVLFKAEFLASRGTDWQNKHIFGIRLPIRQQIATTKWHFLWLESALITALSCLGWNATLNAPSFHIFHSFCPSLLSNYKWLANKHSGWAFSKWVGICLRDWSIYWRLA